MIAQARGHEATRSGENEETRKHGHRGEQRLSDEQSVALHAGDLDEQERKAQAQEVDTGSQARPVIGTPAERRERRQHEDERQRRGERERADQHQVTCVEECQPTLATQRDQFRQKRPTEEVKEVRAVVRRRLDVKLVIREEQLRVVAEQRDRRFVLPWPWHAMAAVHLITTDPGKPDRVEAARLAECPQAADVCRGQVAIADQQRARLPAADHGQALAWIDPERPQRRNRGGEEPGPFARRLLHPTRHCEQAAGCEPRVIVGNRFHGVEMTFRHRLHARARAAVGVERRDLDQVVLATVASDESARVARMETHPRIVERSTKQREHGRD